MPYVNGLHGVAGQAAKAAKREAEAKAAAEAAARHAATQAAKQAARAIAEKPPTDPVAGALGFEVPKKIGGIPFWMLAAGGLLAVMFVMGGKR